MEFCGRLVRISIDDAKYNEIGVLRAVRFTYQKLTNGAGSSREMISKVLKILRIGGNITIDAH